MVRSERHSSRGFLSNNIMKGVGGSIYYLIIIIALASMLIGTYFAQRQGGSDESMSHYEHVWYKYAVFKGRSQYCSHQGNVRL